MLEAIVVLFFIAIIGGGVLLLGKKISSFPLYPFLPSRTNYDWRGWA
jgi:hypothetical protein